MSVAPIKKRLWINIALFASIVVLAAIAWFGAGNGNPSDRPDADSVRQIRIQRADQADIVINKKDQHWQITEPLDMAASPFRINSILNVTAADSYADYAVSDIDTAELELDSSPVTLYLDNHRVVFGGTDPIEEHRYTQFDERVYLLDDHYLPLLTQGLDSLLDTRLIPEHIEIVSIQLPEYTVARDVTGLWQIEPDNAKLGAVDLQQWIDRWRNQRAGRVEFKRDLKIKPKISITLQTGTTQRIVFQLIKADSWSGFYRPDKNLTYIIYSDDIINALLARPTVNSADEHRSDATN